MKKIWIIGLLLAAAPVANAQKVGSVPADVQKTFEEKFPDAKGIAWEKEEGNYEAGFKINHQKRQATFTPEGKWIETETEIKQGLLPKAVKDALQNSEYKNWKIQEVEQLETPDSPVLYGVEVKKNKEKLELYYKPDGALLKKK